MNIPRTNIPRLRFSAPNWSCISCSSCASASIAQPWASLACLSALLLCSAIQIVLIISSSPPLAFHLLSSESSLTFLKNSFRRVSLPSPCPCSKGFVFVILFENAPSLLGDCLFEFEEFLSGLEGLDETDWSGDIMKPMWWSPVACILVGRFALRGSRGDMGGEERKGDEHNGDGTWGV